MAADYVTPKQFLQSKGIKVNVGDILNPTALGMAPNPTYGTLPTVEVTKADEGRFIEGIACCVECETQVVIHAGDWFQKRRCPKCQKRAQRKAANPGLSDEAKALREANKAATAAIKAGEKAQEKAAKAVKKAETVRAKAELKAQEIRAEAEKKVAALSAKAAAVA